jgi:uncharacterized membrane protein
MPADSPTQAAGSAEGKPWILACYILSLIGFGLVSVIIAYVKRGDFANTIWAGHATFIIRTFWWAVLGIVVGIVLTFLLVGIVVLWAVGIWLVVRVVVGLVRAISDQPIANPKTWLV